MPAVKAGTYAPLGSGSPELTRDLVTSAEHGAALGDSETVMNCLTGHVAQYSLGRDLSSEDLACLAASAPAASAGATLLKDIYLNFVTSDLYRIRNFD